MFPRILEGHEATIAEVYIRDISYYRNMFLPVSCLPPELLLYIFSYLLPVIGRHDYRSMNYASCQEELVAGATRNLITATHVCRRWRDIALANSSLWTILWLENRQWLRKMITRCNNAPVTVVQSQNTFADDYLDDVLPWLFLNLQPRRLSIELTSDYRTLYNLVSIPTILVRPAPLLEILEINNVLDRHISDSPLWELLSSEPQRFLGGHAPTLRELSLTNLFFHTKLWGLPILRNLARLSLTENIDHLHPGDVPKPVPLLTVLHALKSMDQLRSLTMTLSPSPWHIPDPACFLLSNEHHSVDIVTLPRLSTLILQGHLRDVTALTHHLRPQAAYIEYVISVQGETFDDTLLSMLSTLVLPTTNGPPVVAVEIAFARVKKSFSEHEMRCSVRLWHNKGDNIVAMDGSGRSKPSFSATFAITIPRGQWEDTPPPAVTESVADNLVCVLNMVLSLLPLDHVQELRCLAVPGKGPETILSLSMHACATILPYFSAIVNTLVMENGAHGLDGLLAALVSDRTLLRRLAAIRFIGWEFAVLLHSYTSRQRGSKGVLSLSQANKLADVLRDVALDRRVGLLEFYKCNITDFFAEEFEGIVDKLVLAECSANFD